MRLYLICNRCHNKVILSLKAGTRGELRRYLGGDRFTLRCNFCGEDDHPYNVLQVRAEKELNTLVPGALIGGVIGLLGGPIGILIGGGLGAAIGGTNDADENRKIERFNKSL